MTVTSLFTGIGGFDLAFQRAGFDLLAQVEIEPFARRVLARHWPDVPKHDDVRKVGAGNLTRPDVLVGGFPCQDLSVAGKREGIGGERSGLFWQFARLARTLKPQWIVVENVPGLLSSDSGRDFGVVVRAMVKRGYGMAWRILDSQYFGVPQRRRRVFLVGCLGGQWERAASVLFEPESGGWDSAAGDQARTRTARGVTDGVGFALRSDPGGNGGLTGGVPFVAATLQGAGHSGQPEPGAGLVMTASSGERARALTASMHKRHDEDTDTLIAFGLRASDGHHGHSSPRGDGCDNLIAAALTGCGIGTCGADDNQAQARHLVASTLPAYSGRQQIEATYLPQQTGVRRLTPLECERLQNFPDGFTCLCGCQPYSTAACKCPDSPRYRALGNAVTVSVVEWIAQRIAQQAMTEKKSATNEKKGLTRKGLRRILET